LASAFQPSSQRGGDQKMLRSIFILPEQAHPTLRQLQAVLRCVMLHFN